MLTTPELRNETSCFGARGREESKRRWKSPYGHQTTCVTNTYLKRIVYVASICLPFPIATYRVQRDREITDVTLSPGSPKLSAGSQLYLGCGGVQGLLGEGLGRLSLWWGLRAVASGFSATLILRSDGSWIWGNRNLNPDAIFLIFVLGIRRKNSSWLLY